MDRREAEHLIQAAAAAVKLACGVGNNAAWYTVLEALDHARQCKTYRGKVKQTFKQAVELFHQYERNLIYAQTNRMFHVADMGEATRKKYGNITDREYYDFWASTGAQAYQATKPLLSSLWNKYRLSLQQHKVSDAEHVAWVMTAQAALELAVLIYGEAAQSALNSTHLPRWVVESIFQQFSLEAVRKRWREALCILSPDSEGYDLTPIESRNIEMGLEQLHDAWLNPSFFFDSTSEAVENYDDVFRTKGEMKKALRELAKLKHDVEEELNDPPTSTI